MAFKIAVDAGHYINTPGKRVPKELDPAQTREWTINDRVARFFAEAAKQYVGVELLRVDDTTGKTDVSLANRCKKANDWGADFYLSIHHNAGINLGKGGGICAFSYQHGTKAAQYRDAIYEACISAGGLKGNRATPKLAKGFYVIKYTKAPAVLMEYGFMDSKVDAPIILTEAYSKLVAYATMDGIAKIAGLKKKPTTVTQETVGAGEQIYRIRTSWGNASSQTGAYKSLESAKKACSVGYSVYDKDGKEVYTNKATSYPVDSAKSFSSVKAGTYIVTATSLNLRCGASTSKQIIETMSKGKTFTCYGYYTGDWLFGISASGKKGFCHKDYLKKK